ncbi:hypothetical protein R5R35_002516 [Gryllus longicercus]|uniref:Chromatin target of PRMT1 protein C-terminal domain-containing protein n=1 Tax=Gryllus longicercus TaxID=2509291 RepID=A0AAN9VH51_9ORTH
MSFKKIVLKSTTVMSLNERFTYLRGNYDHGIHAIRESNALQQQASAKNRRLAQQMERRPAVMAALKLKKWSLRQRLGQPVVSNVKERLTLPAQGGSHIRGRGRGPGRGSLRGRGRSMSLNLGDGTSTRFRRGQGRAFQSSSRRPFKRGVSTSRGLRGARFTRGGNTSQRGTTTLRGFSSSFRRGGRSGGVRGRGRRGGARGRQQKLPSKEELDLQLDQYMANTKSHLDKELDSYMNQTPSENWD